MRLFDDDLSSARVGSNQHGVRKRNAPVHIHLSAGEPDIGKG
jgi:hypothetical protein